MDELIADLTYIRAYAEAINSELLKGNKPTAYANRMAELAEKVQKCLDPNYEEWCDAQADARREPTQGTAAYQRHESHGG